MLTVQEYNQLIQDVADLERREAEAVGALAQMNKALQEEHGCVNLKAGIAAQKKIQAELQADEAKVDQLYATYQTKYGELCQKT